MQASDLSKFQNSTYPILETLSFNGKNYIIALNKSFAVGVEGDCSGGEWKWPLAGLVYERKINRKISCLKLKLCLSCNKCAGFGKYPKDGDLVICYCGKIKIEEVIIDIRLIEGLLPLLNEDIEISIREYDDPVIMIGGNVIIILMPFLPEEIEKVSNYER